MKKGVLFFLIVSMLFCISLPVAAAKEGDFYYDVENGKATITGRIGNPTNPTNLVIPSSLGGYPVTGIGGAAFHSCTSLTSVNIPNSVTYISQTAFYQCTRLSSVTIPNSVTYIGPYAFSGCTSLTSVAIPSSVAEIGDWAFSGCSSLTSINVDEANTVYSSDGSGVLFNQNKTQLIQCPGGKQGAYDIPSSVTKIADWAFSACRGLTSVAIPDSVSGIERGSFAGCSSLTSVTIPESVTYIESNAFSGCTSLTSVTIPNSIKEIRNLAFDGCSSLKSVTIPNSVTKIKAAAFRHCTSLTSVIIPNSIKEIEGTDTAGPGYGVFEGCTSLTSVTIPDSVTKIGMDAFAGCTGLASVTIPDSVKHISIRAFSRCKSLTSVTIPNSVTYINSNAFAGCTGLTSVTIPNSVTKIDSWAFSGCINLTSVIILDGVKGIGSYAFEDCTSLTTVTIPNSVTAIGGSAFSGCTSLTSATIPHSVTTIGTYAFLNCPSLISINVDEANTAYNSDGNGILFDKNKTQLIRYPEGKRGAYAIPNSVAEIGTRAFSSCTGLTSVTIPNNVTTIGTAAFADCTSLTSIAIPNSVTEIGWSAFSSCTDLMAVTIPNSVKKIGEYAFHNCNNLTIYGYSGSYAETYAKNNRIPFVLIGSGANASADDLFTKYPQYLINQAEYTITNNMTKAYLGALDNMSGWKTFAASYLYCLDSGSSILFRDIFSSFGGTFSNNYDVFLDETTNALMLGMPENSTAIKDIADSVAEEYSVVKTGINLYNAADKEYFMSFMAEASPNLSYKQIGELTDVVMENSAKISNFFDKADVVFDVADVIVTISAIQDIRIEVVDSLMRGIRPDSDLYRGLERFRKKMTTDIALTCVSTFLDTKGLGMLTDAYKSALIKCGTQSIAQALGSHSAGVAGILVSVTVKVANFFLPTGDDIIKTQMYASCASILNNSLSQQRVKFINRQVPAANMKQAIADYKNTYTTYLTSMKLALESGRKIAANGWRKDQIDAYLKMLSSYNYDKYIEFCLTALNDDHVSQYTYMIKDGKIVITGYAGKGASRFSIMSMDAAGLSGEEAQYNLLVIPSAFNGVPVTSIGANALNGIEANTIVVIPDGIENIEALAFKDNENIAMVLMGDSITDIGDSAFDGCSQLSAVSLPNNLTTIGASGFANCTSLSSISFPESLDSVGSNAFQNNEGLNDIVVNGSSTVLDDTVFEGCSNLTITGNNNSTAQSFAQANNFAFETLDPVVSAINIQKMPIKTQWVCGDLIKADGMELKVDYSDGSDGIVSSGWALDYDNTVTGDAVVNVLYEGATTSYVVNLSARVDVESVSVSPETINIMVGNTTSVTALISPTDATNKAVSWSSDNANVATVDGDGKVTAVETGTANITATTNDGGKIAVCTVTVTEPIIAVTGVSLNKGSVNLLVGDFETLTATIAPENATNKAVNWNSDNTNVATVDENGKVTAVAPGAANITVTSEDGGKTAVCAVTVTTPVIAVTGVNLNKASLELLVGGSATLTAAVTPENATNKTISWSSANHSVATVDNAGKVTALASGTANITATSQDGGKKAVCIVTVTEPATDIAVTGVSLNKENLELLVGGSETLAAGITPENATNKAVNWSSDNTKVATVDASGKVIAVSSGIANISVTTADGNKTAACKVTVRNPAIKFDDIPATAWYKEYVDDLVSLGILNGKSEGKFDPQGRITRAEFAKILAYASGDDLAPYDKECVFGDSRNHWSKKNINWAYEHQIVKGKGGGFAPNANISRQEMAVMIKRYADYKKITLPKKVEAVVFNDAAKIAGWAKAEVAAMQQATVIGGKPGNLFDPEGNALRCEAAKMISVFLSL